MEFPLTALFRNDFLAYWLKSHWTACPISPTPLPPGGDVDNDGDLDLAYGGSDWDRPSRPYLNTGSVFTLEPVAAGNFSGSLDWGDLTGRRPGSAADAGPDDGPARACIEAGPRRSPNPYRRKSYFLTRTWAATCRTAWMSISWALFLAQRALGRLQPGRLPGYSHLWPKRSD